MCIVVRFNLPAPIFKEGYMTDRCEANYCGKFCKGTSLPCKGERCPMTSDKLRKEIEGIDPTDNDLKDPLFEVIWQVIKRWDISRSNGAGYAGATGTDVMTILRPLRTHIKEREDKIRAECKYSDEPRPCECYDINEQIDKAREEGYIKLIEKHNKEWAEQVRVALIKELEEIKGKNFKDLNEVFNRIDQRISALKGGGE